ncbi:hypothetical protein F1520_17110 [Yersinia pestis]|uniref:Uncharacterized protein n=1 Tax=Yersinia pseudotuberculosis TaxID=633 RepID=A0ABM7ANF6_YERPU|nr:hypothetical protein CEQ20_22340 [Yersinia pseudotuberculosis]AYW85726.1 hypothetical protein EGX42_19935 [Yersinia pestis]QFR87263.1 hypothetical protein DJY80_03560 [Yersinia pestis subsp. pestis bv. Medievalis]AYW89861.1 hypothetical protein EGX87_20365 [Yersinia pseudotuberculosis]AYW94124.1 hypothetical protein EGX47_03245 [Yersinia pseudotuberculosis]
MNTRNHWRYKQAASKWIPRSLFR